MDYLPLIISAIGGYLLGSMPFGLLLARAFGQGDIRQIGSGNIGATNVLRTGRKDLAIATLLLDAGKAGIAALIAGMVFAAPLAPLFAGGMALIGHCFPLWLKFKGGKGVATFFGVLFAIKWPIGLVAGGIWLLSAFITRYSSLSALLAAIGAPIAALIMGYQTLAIFFALLAIVIFHRHRENIARLLSGSEGKIGDKKKAKNTQDPTA